MKRKILVTRNLLQENEERIKKLFDVKVYELSSDFEKFGDPQDCL